ncbi:MAG: BrnT family toxin [Candidatus Brevundimonas colombiensis]|uniref:BrnT family toxin n=1 Tax=Candidatus Brevundimonas colombiensis TaxID=3121376 RepID=A0AAJ5WZZ6_9CAUL|nr:BrnT family toxin [Brevundimonas sp.]WEK38702.1 MAG: BrnT family toxin [Brevundimonas sp.]
MRLTFDPSKRERTLAERGLDFAQAAIVFEGDHLTFEDDRQDYGERRLITIGRLIDRMVVLVWTPRGDARHIISMRKANDREQRRYEDRLGRS